MKRTCETCVHCVTLRKGFGDQSYLAGRCLLSGLKVVYSMIDCPVYKARAEVVVEQQAQDEKWRSGATVPLAVSE